MFSKLQTQSKSQSANFEPFIQIEQISANSTSPASSHIIAGHNRSRAFFITIPHPLFRKTDHLHAISLRFVHRHLSIFCWRRHADEHAVHHQAHQTTRLASARPYSA